MVVTAHWIDENWKMQKRIISFKPITDHRGATIAGQLLECIDEWGIEKIFTITVDNASGNTSALKIFQDTLRLRGDDMLIQHGAFMHMRCCAHILNLIVRDGMEHVNGSVVAVRNAVKYVRSSYARLKSFELRIETGKINRGSLALDCSTRWNSTYLMLVSALKLRVAFEKMLVEDKLYGDYFLEKEETEKSDKKRIGPPTASDWDEVYRLVKFLRIFHKCTLAFSASTTVTSTICYNQICNIESNLISLSNNIDPAVRIKAISMREKFDKYWDGFTNMNGLVVVASVFNPVNKMQFLSLCFEKLYGKGSVESEQRRAYVLSLLRKLYDEYVKRLKPSLNDPHIAEPVEKQSNAPMDLSDDEDGYEMTDSVIYDQMFSQQGIEKGYSELEIYLMEKVEPQLQNGLGMEFDVLSWWKSKTPKYPILAELARDVLAVQVSTVASESAFSTSGRILDPYRSSLTPYMVEALICTQQWLRSSLKGDGKIPTLVQMMEELDFHESLDSRNSPINFDTPSYV